MNGQNVDWSSRETVFQVLRNLVEPCRVSFEHGKVLRCSQSAPLTTAVGSESVYSWSDPLQKARSQAVARIADRTASQQTLVISDCC